MSTSLKKISDFGDWGVPLRINRRGNFFSDEGFADFRHPFESAANDLLCEMEKVRAKENSFNSFRTLREKQMSGNDLACKMEEEQDKYKIVMDMEEFADCDLHVRVISDTELIVEGRKDQSGVSSVTNRSVKRKFILPESADLEKATSNLSSDGILTINVPKKITATTGSQQTSVKIETSEHHKSGNSESVNIPLSSKSTAMSSLASKQETNSDFKDLDLEIMPKKSFFDDSFFDKERISFQKSIQEMLDRQSEMKDVHSKGGLEGLRRSKSEQAVSVTEDSKEHKIVLDVVGFKVEDLNVRAVSDYEIVVEGRTETKSNNTCCSNSFKRRFAFPSSAIVKEATTALSSEGILTVTVPKKQFESLDFNIPVKTEVAAHISEVIQKEQNKDSSLQSKADKYSETTSSNTFQSTTKKTNFETDHNLEKKIYENYPSTSIPSTPEKTTNLHTKEIKISNTSSDNTNNKTIIDESLKSEKEDFYTRSKIHPISKEIPVQLKGSFYNEPIFDEARKSLENELKNVFTDFNKQKSSEKQVVEIKQTNVDSLAQDNQQVTSTFIDDAHHFKIVIDVQGYKEHELKVKISGTNEITIEGNSQRTSEGITSKHSFQRTVQFPCEVDLDRTTTALSEEGILTVTTPKLNQLILKEENICPVSSKLESEFQKSKEIKTYVVDSRGDIQNVEQRNMKTNNQSDNARIQTTEKNVTDFHSTNTPREYIVPLTVEEASNSHKMESNSNLQSSISSISNTSKDVSQGILSNSTTASSIQSQLENRNLGNQDRSTLSNEISGESVNNCANNRQIQFDTKSLFNIPISKKGHFFDDSFFQDSHSMFGRVLKDHMRRFDCNDFFTEDLGFFRSLRDRKLTGESQIDSLSEDDKFKKIVLDVNGFNENNLKVKALSENEIQIEGEIEEKAGNSFSKRRFKKQFLLPEIVDLKNATSAISSDGILNIRIPKKH